MANRGFRDWDFGKSRFWWLDFNVAKLFILYPEANFELLGVGCWQDSSNIEIWNFTAQKINYVIRKWWNVSLNGRWLQLIQNNKILHFLPTFAVFCMLNLFKLKSDGKGFVLKEIQEMKWRDTYQSIASKEKWSFQRKWSVTIRGGRQKREWG